jgi:uncharacterized protein YcfL
MKLALLALVACLGLVACGSNKQSPADAKQQLCSSVNAFAASVTSLQGLGLSSSKDELQSAVDNIQKRPTNEPVQQVVAGLAPTFTAFADAWREFASSLQCKSSS